ncbi:MAG: hypothetical protein ACLFV6_02830 [Spirulinaceae cyanobacterium]
MNTTTPGFTDVQTTTTLQKTVVQVCSQLEGFLCAIASNGTLLKAIQTTFGDRFNPDKLEYLRQDWETYCFESLPQIEICNSEEIHGLNSLFSPDRRTIYLAQEYICWKSTQTCDIIVALLEAIGCFIDYEIESFNSNWGQGLLLAESLVRVETKCNCQ